MRYDHYIISAWKVAQLVVGVCMVQLLLQNAYHVSTAQPGVVVRKLNEDDPMQAAIAFTIVHLESLSQS